MGRTLDKQASKALRHKEGRPDSERHIANRAHSRRAKSMVRDLGLQALFNREPERDADRRQQHRQLRRSAEKPASGTAKPALDRRQQSARKIRHPIYPDHILDLELFLAAFDTSPLLQKLYDTKLLRYCATEQLTELTYQIVASNILPPPAESKNVEVDAWSQRFLGVWLMTADCFKAAALATAPVDQLRDVWFAVQVLVANGHMQDADEYRYQCKGATTLVKSARGDTGSVSGRYDGQSLIADVFIEEGDDQDDIVGIACYWTLLGRGHGLNAARGLQLMQSWAL